MNFTSSPPVIPPMQKLQCVVQTYAWGKLGLESSVAQLKVRQQTPCFHAHNHFIDLLYAVVVAVDCVCVGGRRRFIQGRPRDPVRRALVRGTLDSQGEYSYCASYYSTTCFYFMPSGVIFIVLLQLLAIGWEPMQMVRRACCAKVLTSHLY